MFKPYSVYDEVLYQIKSALNSSPRYDLDVRLKVPIDLLSFHHGFQEAGHFVRRSHGHDVYGIRNYSDLDSLLGRKWHIRVLNKQFDFCYVIKDTVTFYVHHRKAIIDPTDDSLSVDGGYILEFRFVRGDGVKRQWECIASSK